MVRLRVAHASRVLVDASRDDELFLVRGRHENRSLQGKFVAVEHRDQHARRMRYPEGDLTP